MTVRIIVKCGKLSGFDYRVCVCFVLCVDRFDLSVLHRFFLLVLIDRFLDKVNVLHLD